MATVVDLNYYNVTQLKREQEEQEGIVAIVMWVMILSFLEVFP